jgi:hypothetical protein
VDANDFVGVVDLRRPSDPHRSEHPFGEHPMRSMGRDHLFGRVPDVMLASLFPTTGQMLHDNTDSRRSRLA